jgi:NAD(P)H-dependent flavin oxidoreductase YrpB (nitropropane dioxygenase family)
VAKTKAAPQSGGTATAESPASPPQGMTKAKAIAEAFRHLGKGASNQDLIGYAMQKFGIEVSPNYVSILKSDLKKKRRGPRKAAVAVPAEGNGHAAERRLRNQPATDLVALIREAKALAQKAGGMAELKRLVDALAE